MTIKMWAHASVQLRKSDFLGGKGGGGGAIVKREANSAEWSRANATCDCGHPPTEAIRQWSGHDGAKKAPSAEQCDHKSQLQINPPLHGRETSAVMVAEVSRNLSAAAYAVQPSGMVLENKKNQNAAFGQHRSASDVRSLQDF